MVGEFCVAALTTAPLAFALKYGAGKNEGGSVVVAENALITVIKRTNNTKIQLNRTIKGIYREVMKQKIASMYRDYVLELCQYIIAIDFTGSGFCLTVCDPVDLFCALKRD